jgi:hypothetical protein
MSDGETLAESVPPPASRLGAVLGWGLLALGVAFLIASQWVGINSDAAWSAAQAHVDSAARAVQAHPASSTAYTAYEAAYAAYLAARAAYAEISLRSYLFVAAGWLSLLTAPGLLYARDPSLLGGPPGRLFRWLARRLERGPERRHPVNFYQGVGFVLLSIAFAVYAFGGYVSKLFINVPIGSAADEATVWLIFLAYLLPIPVFVVSIPLTFGGPWYFRWRRI